MNVNKSKSYFVLHNKRENVHNISEEHCIDQCCVFPAYTRALNKRLCSATVKHCINVD